MTLALTASAVVALVVTALVVTALAVVALALIQGLSGLRSVRAVVAGRLRHGGLDDAKASQRACGLFMVAPLRCLP